MSDFSLILVLQFKTSVNRNKTWQRYKENLKNSHLMEAFFNHGAIWLHAFTYYRPDTWSEMPQYHRIPVQPDCPLDFIRPFLAMTMPEQAHHCSSGSTKPFADERVLLCRLMRGGCNIASNAPSLISSNASYMQFWHHPQSHQGTDTG